MEQIALDKHVIRANKEEKLVKVSTKALSGAQALPRAQAPLGAQVLLGAQDFIVESHLPSRSAI